MAGIARDGETLKAFIMDEQKIDLGAVWHLFQNHYQAAILTLCGLEVEERHRLVGQPWESLSNGIKDRILELLENLDSAA